MRKADEAARIGGADILLDACLIKAEALYKLDEPERALEVLGAETDPGFGESRYGVTSALLRSCLIATIKLRRGRPADAFNMCVKLEEWLDSAPPVWCETWMLLRATELCWLLGTYNYYREALTLTDPILDRFAAEDFSSMREDVCLTRLMKIIALRNTIREGSEDERLVADAVTAFVAEGNFALKVLGRWERGLIAMGGELAPPRLVMAETLKAMTHLASGDTEVAKRVLDDVIGEYEESVLDTVHAALEGARLIREQEFGV